jgi:hypothetical protein
MMPRFTPEAQMRFDEYLAHARAALAGHLEVSAEDIEQDVRAHIAAEFPPGSGWVRLDQLEAVLVRLGRPEQWVADEDRPVWRRGFDWVRTRPTAVGRRVRVATDRLRNGPDDWRLAYITFGLLLIGVFIFPLLIVLLPASYLVGRAALTRARESGHSLGGQKWLVYPPLVIVSLPLLVGLLLWPLGPGAAIADDVWRHNRDSIRTVLELPRGLSEFLTYVYFMGGALSIWWLVLGTVFLAAPRLPAALFPPLVSRPGRSLGAWLFAPAVVLFAGWVSATARTVPVADWLQEKPWLRESQAFRDTPRSTALAVVPSRSLDEQTARAAAGDFFRALRVRQNLVLRSLCDVPFLKIEGPPLFGQRRLTMISDPEELQKFLDVLARETVHPEQLSTDIRRSFGYARLRDVLNDDELRHGLDEVLRPNDWIVIVGQKGREAGTLLIQVRKNRASIVGMGPPQLLGDRE